MELKKILIFILFSFSSFLMYSQTKLIRCTNLGWDASSEFLEVGYENLYQYDENGELVFEEYRTKGVTSDSWLTSYSWTKYHYQNGTNTIEFIYSNWYTQGNLAKMNFSEVHRNQDGLDILNKVKTWTPTSDWIWENYYETKYNDEGCSSEILWYEVVNENPILKSRTTYLSDGDCGLFFRERIEEDYVNGEYVLHAKYSKNFISDNEYYELVAYWDYALNQLGANDTLSFRKLNSEGQLVYYEDFNLKKKIEYNQDGVKVLEQKFEKHSNGLDWLPLSEEIITYEENLRVGDAFKLYWQEDISEWGLVTTNLFEYDESDRPVKHVFMEKSFNVEIIPREDYVVHFEYEECNGLLKKGIRTTIKNGEVVGESRGEYEYLEEEECENFDLESPIDFFPNPTNGVITLSSNLLKSSDVHLVEVFNSLGIFVKAQRNYQAKEIEIDLTNVPAGIYFITFRIAGKQKVGKVIKY